MPNLPDFLNIPILRNQLQAKQNDPYKTGVDSYLRGYNQFYEPQRILQDVEKGRLENALKQAREPYVGEEARLGNEMTKAQIKQMQERNMYGDLTGEVGNALKVAMLERQLGPDDPRVMAAKEQLKLQQDKDRSLMQHRAGIGQSRDWNSLGQSAKENTLSLARAISPNTPETEFVRFFKNGGTFEELGEMNGLTPEQISKLERQYATTNSSISSIQQARGAEAELKTMDKFISESFAPYSDRFAGYSTKQIIDSFSNNPKDIDKQAKFLAARAIAAEQTAIRARLAGTSTAQEALREMKNLSLNEANVIRPLVKPEVYQKMQKYISETLSEAAHERIKSMSPSNTKSSNKNNDPLGLFD